MPDKLTIKLPDLRFEQLFRQSLNVYAATTGKASAFSTPSVSIKTIVYAVIKDQIIMQFLQGFGTAAVLMSLRPYSKFLLRSGQRWGLYLRNNILRVARFYGGVRTV